jgi:predicted outer membrane protein
MMVADHSKGGREFKSAVRAAGMAPPPERLDPRHRAILSTLRQSQGRAFDLAYVNAQLQAQAVTLLQRYAKSGRTKPLRAFAQNGPGPQQRTGRCRPPTIEPAGCL